MNNIINISKLFSNIPTENILFQEKENIIVGNICNIYYYTIILSQDNSTDIKEIILKISNFDNVLSIDATELNLYENELYFYNNISKIINNIKIPVFYGSFKEENKHGILLENLSQNYNGNFNKNLNTDIQLIIKVLEYIHNLHNTYYFNNADEIIDCMKKLKKVNEIDHYSNLINKQFNNFMKLNDDLTEKNKQIILNIYNNFDNLLKESSTFPLSFCHGDLKSGNIFFKDDTEPYFFDWQYIHLNKGVSDIVFFLVECIEFNEHTTEIVEKYYFKLLTEKHPEITYETYKKDFINSLCIFPFFVMIWFNSKLEYRSKDNDYKDSSTRFMNNLLLYLEYYL